MNRIVLVVPHLLAADPAESVLRSESTTLARLAQQSRVVRLAPLEAASVPECAFLGLRPGAVDIAQGPLTVAALGIDPPERSVHFHLSLLSLDDSGVIREPHPIPSEEQLAPVLDAMTRLSGRALTVVPGRGADHALVWEGGSIDLYAAPKSQALGQAYGTKLPEGDGEPLLRRLIDDSVNLLSGLELNRRRAEEGLPQLNLLWPWGPGFRPRLPNRALERGEPCRVMTRSTRIVGLARLTGEKVADAAALGNGINLDLEAVLESCLGSRLSLVVLDGFAQCRRHGRLERAEWLLSQFDSRFVRTVAELPPERPVRLTLLAPSGQTEPESPVGSPSDGGLALRYDNRSKQASTIPFDERALDDPRLPVQNVWEAVQEAMACGDGQSW